MVNHQLLLTSDWETTTSNKGSPHDRTNRAVALGVKINDNLPHTYFDVEDQAKRLWETYKDVALFIFFNAKFDLGWYRRHNLFAPINIWDCQLAEFYLAGQRNPYPSLEDTSARYGLGKKIDVIKLEYWDKGIDTDQIPRDILYEYANQDVNLTYQIYLKQVEQFKKLPKLYALFKIACEDLQVLEEMERNGLAYDPDLIEQRALETRKALEQVDIQLNMVYPDLDINFGSGDQLSAFLYGGVIKREHRDIVGFYKTGSKIGQPRYSVKEVEHQLPRLVEPLPRSELQKEGFYSTDEGTLRKLKGKAAKKYVPLLLERARLEKLLGTYYEGIPKLVNKMNWEPGYIHGQFNQVVAATGRLSSVKPNLQNFAGEIEDVFITRY